ncbi:MAG TPA: phospholipid carrier-dependent glycosyltransferase [Chthoniobacter sp.]|jgi:hypothetical protein
MIETESMKLALAPEPEEPKEPKEVAPPPPPSRAHWCWWLAAVALAAGLFLRIWPWAGFTGIGFDEAIYRDDVIKLEAVGLSGYPAICQRYLEDQRKPEVITKLPPTRFLYIYTAWMWKEYEFGDAKPVSPKAPNFAQLDPALLSLHHVACLFSCLGLIASGLAAWRILGLRALPGVLALVAFSPLQIHLAQHALIDGVFTFWAIMNLWLLWENLRRPNDLRLLAAFAVTLALMVLTKENSFFVYLALGGLVVVNRWAKFGTVTPSLLIAGIAGPLVGVGTLILLAGGFAQFSEIYHLLVSKAETLTYAIKTGDGPWYRYIVDLLLISPLVLILAIGGIFTQVRKHPAYVYLVAFVGFSYAVMCNIRYGMNLRYASIWDLPLRALAAAQVAALAGRFGTWQPWVTGVAIAALCAYDLRQYHLFFVHGGLYELVTGGLLQILKILK